jgi:hypothetical protein
MSQTYSGPQERPQGEQELRPSEIFLRELDPEGQNEQVLEDGEA